MSKLLIDLSPQELSKDKSEFNRFLSAIKTFELYTIEWNKKINKMSSNFMALGEKYLSKMNYDYKDRLKRYSEGIDLNQKFLSELILKYKPDSSYYEKLTREELNKLSTPEEKFFLYDSVFVYIFRDWTELSKKEREEHYGGIIKEVKKYFKPGNGNYKFLLPGASLCRLSYELAKFGFDVESNDYSFFNAIIADYLFNYSSKKDQFSYQPMIHNYSDLITEETAFKAISFPDEDINLINCGKMSMTVGDFNKIYKNKKEMFDCVITCFFIDTGKNVIEYVENIYNCLKKGGIWINFGPLSYHWAENYEEVAIELPYDKLKEVIINYGFDYVNESQKLVTFGEIDGLLKKYKYHCIFFSCIKK